MALSHHQLQALIGIAKPGMCIASMGYPDIISSEADLQAILGTNAQFLEYRKDSEDLAKWHNTTTTRIPSAESLFS